jgi:hypothetical protein
VDHPVFGDYGGLVLQVGGWHGVDSPIHKISSRKLNKSFGLDTYQGYDTKARKTITLSVSAMYVPFIRQEQFNFC